MLSRLGKEKEKQMGQDQRSNVNTLERKKREPGQADVNLGITY